MPPRMSRIKFPHVEPTRRVKVMQYFMTIFCALFFVFGLSVIICGAVLASQRPADCSFFARFYTGAYLLLAAGCATSFFSLLFCLHVQRSLRSLEFIHMIVVMVVVLAVEVMSAVAAHILYVMAEKGELGVQMKAAWNKYYENDDSNSCVDGLQDQLGCCGIDNHTEWITLFTTAKTSPQAYYPSSCLCATTQTSNCFNATVITVLNSTSITEFFYVHSNPCYSLVLDDLYDTLLVPRVVGPIIAFVELAFGCLVGYLLHHIDNHSLVGSYIVQSGEGGGGGDGNAAGSNPSEWNETRNVWTVENGVHGRRSSDGGGSGDRSNSASSVNGDKRMNANFQVSRQSVSISRDETLHVSSLGSG